MLKDVTWAVRRSNLCMCLVSFCYRVGIGLLRNEWKPSDQTDGAWAKGGGRGVSRSSGWRVDIRGEGKGRKREDLTENCFLPKSDSLTKHLALWIIPSSYVFSECPLLVPQFGCCFLCLFFLCLPLCPFVSHLYGLLPYFHLCIF